MEAGALPILRHARRTERTFRRRLVRTVSLAFTIGVVLVWVALLRPASLGGPADYVIVTGASMEPTLRSGDVVIALRQSSYEPGDLVVYRVPTGEPAAGSTIIHRIVGGSGELGFRVRGDNKEGIDPWRPKTDDVVGKARLTVPRVGSVLIQLRSPLGIALVAGLTTFLIALLPAEARRRKGQS